MNLFSVKNLSKGLGGIELFSDITFGLETSEKAALIGANGSGKSTLLRLLAGREQPDSGTVAVRNDLRFAFLPQIPEFDAAVRIMDHVLSGSSPVAAAVRDYEICVHRLSAGKPVRAELERLTHEMDRLNGWNLENRIHAVLDRLGLTDPEQPMGTLSGGMIRKVEIARAFLGEYDLLLLDEPTNHLDPDTAEWLRDMLARTKAAVFLVTHDRYFLESVCTKIYELDDRRLYSYEGNYSTYLSQRAERMEQDDRRQQRIASVLRRELVWLKRGPRARTGKDKHRQETVRGMMDSVTKKEEDSMEFSASIRRLGKKVLEVKNVSKSFGEKTILSDFSFSFSRGDRIGILGPNGSGKSTFLNLLSGRLLPDTGSVEPGINTKFGYFDQLSGEMDRELTVYSYLADYADDIRRAGGETMSVSTLLEEFKFPESRQRTKIGNLSGGERRRLHLLKTLVPAPNFLLFDEPTNDLDIRTLSLLEDFLQRFDGCIVAVSHDRYFLDRVAGLLLVFDGSGAVKGFAGTASEYLTLAHADSADDSRNVTAGQNRNASRAASPNSAEAGLEKKKLTFRERGEFEALLPELDMLEKEKTELESVFVSAASPDIILSAQKRYREVLDLIERKTARWEELADRE